MTKFARAPGIAETRNRSAARSRRWLIVEVTPVKSTCFPVALLASLAVVSAADAQTTAQPAQPAQPAQTAQTAQIATAAAPTPASMSASIGVVVFPAKGQSAEQQHQDEGTCYAWAKGQTGVDPMAVSASQPPPAAPAPTNSQPQGNVVKGAARGAVAGTAIGAVAGNTGKGAAIGATAGGLAGVGANQAQKEQAKQQAAQQQQQAVQQHQAAQQQQMDLFRKGFSACMEGKGYTVK